MKKFRFLTVIVLSIALLVLVIGPATAAFACEEGLTPGYWKQEHHFDDWVLTGWTQDELVDEVFKEVLKFNPDFSGPYDPAFVSSLANGVDPTLTLIQALKLGGGGERAFLRHAVAAVLNSYHPDIDHVSGIVLARWIYYAYSGYYSFETVKNTMEGWNTQPDPW